MINKYRYGAGQIQTSFSATKISGADIEDFLQNQATFDTKKLNSKDFHLVSFLDSQGRIDCYGWILKQKDSFIFLAPTILEHASFERLNKYLVSEDVTIDPFEIQDWTIILGAKSSKFKSVESFVGEIFGEEAILIKGDAIADVPILNNEEIDLWMCLTGSPSFDGHEFKRDLINNLRLYDLSVSQNKGCYPGQETVSKIATRRGAAYAPVLIELKEKINTGSVISFDKKIGEIESVHEWQGHHYALASLLRDFRVDKMNLSFSLGEKSYLGIIRYLPLISGNKSDKAEELFFSASEYFKKDDYLNAEYCMRLAIEIDPTYTDAYEGLGVMLGRLERFPEAIELMNQLSIVDPKSVLAHTNKSLYLMRLGKIEEAEVEKSQATIKSFQQFGEVAKSKEEEARQKLVQESEWVKRESMFLQVLEIDVEDTLANYGIGSIALERADWPKAVTHLEKVLTNDPAYSVAYLALGKAYKGLQMKELAQQTWKKGIEIAAKKGDLMPANQMQSELERL